MRGVFQQPVRAVSDQMELILLAPGRIGGAAVTRKTVWPDAVASGKPSDKVDARRSPTSPIAKRGGGRLCANASGLRLDHSYGYALHRTPVAPLGPCRTSAPPEWFHLVGYCSSTDQATCSNGDAARANGSYRRVRWANTERTMLPPSERVKRSCISSSVSRVRTYF